MTVENVTVHYDRVDPKRVSSYDEFLNQWTTTLFPWRLSYMGKDGLVECEFEKLEALVSAICRVNGRRSPPHVFIAGVGWRQRECEAECKIKRLNVTLKGD